MARSRTIPPGPAGARDPFPPGSTSSGPTADGEVRHGVAVRRASVIAAVLAMSLVLLSSPSPARALELGDLFRTPDQRAAALHAAGEHEALLDGAPDAAWEGIGRYATGDASGAAESFERALEAGDASSGARDELLYNRATAETRAGRLDEAIALYDEVLENDPGHEDARHNRDVARALQALEEQEQASSENGEEGEEGEEGGEDGEGEGRAGEGEEGESGRDGDESGAEGEAGDPEDGTRASDGESTGDPENGEGAGDEASADASGGDAGATGEAAEARAAAEAALEAERRRAESLDGDDPDAAFAQGETRTPTEREQATEQWLRRIPDDPSGLLRRRLEQSHRGDYPEVGDGDEPW